MTFAAYTSGSPNPLNDPSVDVFTMQSNSNAIPQLIDIDHVGFNSTYGGTHEQVQLQELSGIAPPGIPTGLVGNGFGTLYTNVTNANGELWYVKGASTTGIQLTGPYSPSTLTNNYTPQSGGGAVGVNYSAGYTFIPGGILYQYGSFIKNSGISPSTGIVKFPATFTNASSIIVIVSPITPTDGTSQSHTISVINGTTTTTQFEWNYDSSTTSYVGFSWIAIGN